MSNTDSTYREKGRAVFLAAIMVLSVVSMSAAFAGGAAAIPSNNNVLDADDVAVATDDPVTQNVSFTAQNGSDYNTTRNSNPNVTFSPDAGLSFNTTSVTATNPTGTNFSSDVSATIVGSDVVVEFDETNLSSNAGELKVTVELGVDTDDATVGQGTYFLGSDNGTNQSVNFSVAGGFSVDDLAAPGAVSQGDEFTATANVTNVGGSADTQTISFSFDGTEVATKSISLNANETQEVTYTFDVPSAQSTGATDFSIGSNEDTTTNQITVANSDDDAFITGDVRDSDGNQIQNVEDTLIRVYNNETSSSTPILTFSPNANGEYTERVPITNSTSGDEYTVEAELQGFDSYARTAQVEAGATERFDIRLDRQIDTDELNVVDPAEDPVNVDLESNLDITVEALTEDNAGDIGNLTPFVGEDVDVTIDSVNDPNNANIDAGNVTVSDATITTDTNGEATVNVELDLAGAGVTADELDQDISVTVLFEADSSSESATQTINFEAEPPSGSGTISGEVSEISQDIDLGAQSNGGAAAGVNVHAVQFDRVAVNTAQINAAQEDDQYRIVTFDEGEVQTVQDTRLDYLTTSAEAELVQNETTAGFDIASQPDNDGTVSIHFLRPGDYQVQELNETSGNFENTTYVGDSNADTQFEATEDLTYDATEERFNNSDAVHTDETDSNGQFRLLNLYTNGTTGVDYVVIAGDESETGDSATEYGFANFDGFDIVNVTQNAASGSAQNSVDLGIQEFQPNRIVEYRLDVTVADNEKSTSIPFEDSTDVQVTVEDKLLSEDNDQFAPSQNTDIELDRIQPTSDDPIPDNIGDLDSIQLTTDENGVATTTFEALPAAQAQAGNLNVSAQLAEANNDGDVFETQGSQQAQIEVFGAGEITGDVVDEQNNNFGGAEDNRAEVSLYNQNDLQNPIQTTTTGPEGSYTFTDVRTGNDYRVVASFGNENGFSDIDDLPGGTTNADIVITGTEAPAGFDVVELNPDNVTVTQGDVIDVTASVVNTAGQEDTQDVSFRVSDENGSTVVDVTQEVTIGAGETSEVTFSDIDTSTLDAGEYTHGAFPEDGTELTATLTVDSGDESTDGELPAELDGQVTLEQYNAVTNDAGELGAPELSAAINQWADTGSVNGVDIGAPELSALINYWSN